MTRLQNYQELLLEVTFSYPSKVVSLSLAYFENKLHQYASMV